MDKNVRFKGVFNGQLLLEELDTLGRVVKQVKVNPQNLLGREYACSNFCVLKSGEVMLKVGNKLVTGLNAPLRNIKDLRSLVLVCNGKELNTLVAEATNAVQKVEAISVDKVQHKKAEQNPSLCAAPCNTNVQSDGIDVALVKKLTDALKLVCTADNKEPDANKVRNIIRYKVREVVQENYNDVIRQLSMSIDTSRHIAACKLRGDIHKSASDITAKVMDNIADTAKAAGVNIYRVDIHEELCVVEQNIIKKVIDEKAKILGNDKIIALCIIKESPYRSPYGSPFDRYTGYDDDETYKNLFSDRFLYSKKDIFALTTKGWMQTDEFCNYVECGKCLNIKPSGAVTRLENGQDFDLYTVNPKYTGSTKDIYARIQSKEIGVKVRTASKASGVRANTVYKGKDDGLLGTYCDAEEVLIIFKDGVKIVRVLENSDKKYEIRMERLGEAKSLKVNVSKEMDELLSKLKNLNSILSFYKMSGRDSMDDREKTIVEAECKKIGLECKISTIHERAHNDIGYSGKDNYSYSGWKKLCIETGISLNKISGGIVTSEGERILFNGKGIFSRFRADSFYSYKVSDIALASDGLYVFILEEYEHTDDGYRTEGNRKTPVKIEIYDKDKNKVL